MSYRTAVSLMWTRYLMYSEPRPSMPMALAYGIHAGSAARNGICFRGEPVIYCSADVNGLLGLENGLEHLQSVCLKWAFWGLFAYIYQTDVLYGSNQIV